MDFEPVVSAVSGLHDALEDQGETRDAVPDAESPHEQEAHSLGDERLGCAEPLPDAQSDAADKPLPKAEKRGRRRRRRAAEDDGESDSAVRRALRRKISWD
jgi:hypothetical protein